MAGFLGIQNAATLPAGDGGGGIVQIFGDGVAANVQMVGDPAGGPMLGPMQAVNGVDLFGGEHVG